ncbi:MAG: response regulator transcription factor [Pseudomonadota bacterium]
MFERNSVLLFVGYGLALAIAVFLMSWLDVQFHTRQLGIEIYIGLVALGFAALGIWVGLRLTRQRARQGFQKNMAALKSLDITDREYSVLELIASGQSNKEIARALGISPNTVKTHSAHLFRKLEASKRTEAVFKARRLELIP